MQASTVVGYMNKDAQKNVTTMGTMFMAVGDEAISIQNLVPTKKTGGTAPSVYGGVYIQTLTSAKAENEKFYWYMDDEEEPPLELMWYNKDKKTPATKVFQPGDGFFFTANADIQLQVSGEVLTTNVLKLAQKNVTVFCNPYAVDLPIANLVPTKKSSTISVYGGVYIQTLTAAKAEDEKFYWYMDDEEEPPLELMWYNKDKKTPATKAFKPGEGFFYTANVESYLQFIAPTL